MEEKLSSDFEWHDHFEHYQFLAGIFDVNKARKIIKENPRPIQQVNIVKIPTGIHGLRPIAEIDLEIPIILATIADTHWPIDGWNRIEKAHQQKIEFLPCVILSDKETRKIRLR